jgi:hypothetical protein
MPHAHAPAQIMMLSPGVHGSWGTAMEVRTPFGFVH